MCIRDRAQLYTEQKKFKAKMAYADKLGIPYVIFLGEDEIAAGEIKWKDMSTGEQFTAQPDVALSKIFTGIMTRSAGKPIQE